MRWVGAGAGQGGATISTHAIIAAHPPMQVQKSFFTFSSSTACLPQDMLEQDSKFLVFAHHKELLNGITQAVASKKKVTTLCVHQHA